MPLWPGSQEQPLGTPWRPVECSGQGTGKHVYVFSTDVLFHPAAIFEYTYSPARHAQKSGTGQRHHTQHKCRTDTLCPRRCLRQNRRLLHPMNEWVVEQAQDT